MKSNVPSPSSSHSHLNVAGTLPADVTVAVKSVLAPIAGVNDDGTIETVRSGAACTVTVVEPTPLTDPPCAVACDVIDPARLYVQAFVFEAVPSVS